MGGTRELTRPPAMLGLQARAALALIPHASALPFIAGGGGEVPDRALTLRDATLDTARVQAYANVCAFDVSDTLPPTAPHLLAFPLHMALMTAGSFPLSPIGLVHVANRISVRRPIGVREPLELRVRATPLEPHARGRAFTIVTEGLVGDELVWEEHSTMLKRTGAGPADTVSAEARSPLEAKFEWRLPESLGRAYARVSGDRNPIHLHALSARPFGFPRAIAHGMWAKARSLAALQHSLPRSYTVEVRFRKPILLPAELTFAEASDRSKFEVRSRRDPSRVHLEGTVAT
jgi:acyl dehydratase